MVQHLQYNQYLQRMTLRVLVRDGKFSKNSSWLSKIDPFVLIKVGPTSHKTKVCRNSGKVAVWMDQLQFAASNGQMTVEAWDKGVIKDTSLGSGSFNLNNIYQYPKKSFQQTILLNNGGQSTGEIHLTLLYKGPSLAATIPYQTATQGYNPYLNPPPYSLSEAYTITGTMAQQMYGQNQYGTYGQANYHNPMPMQKTYPGFQPAQGYIDMQNISNTLDNPQTNKYRVNYQPGYG